MSSTDSNRFVGYLVSVECKNIFYQGIVTTIDSAKAIIQLKNCFQNGIHCGNKIVEIKTGDIENIEILADPQNAVTLLKPKLLSEYGTDDNTVNTKENTTPLSSTNKISTNVNNNASNSNINRLLQNLAASQTNSSQNKTNDSFKKTSNVSLVNSTSVNSSLARHNSSSPPNNSSTTNGRKLNGNQYVNNYDSHDNCFNSISVDTIKGDFDFESNLAMFDKNAFYEEMEGHSRPPKNPTDHLYDDTPAYESLKHVSSLPVIPSSSQSSSTFTQTNQRYHQITLANLFSSKAAPTNGNNTNNNSSNHQNAKNYRFDEMVLDTGEPIEMQQIKITTKSNNAKTYVTDDGFIVPCIDSDLRRDLFLEAYKKGFSQERQIECLGRCCAEMALQLLGGPIRFSAKNNHQKPSILVLANSHDLQGSYALCTARLLSIRGVKVYLFVYDKSNKMFSNVNSSLNDSNNYKIFQNELKLFLSNDDSSLIKQVNNVDEIKNLSSIDLIINGLDASGDLEKHAWYRSLIRNVSNLKASVLAVDPDKDGSSLFKSKWCIVPVMPMEMSSNCGRIYLCDLGFTKNIFQSVNIKYKSPFGAKFLIPLHSD